MSSSGARHTRSASLMSYEEDEEGSPSYGPTVRRRTVAPSSNHQSYDYTSYRQPPPEPQYTKSGASLKPPPPSSTVSNNHRSSLIDDDSSDDDNNGGGGYPAAGGRIDYPGVAARAGGGGMGGGNYGMTPQGQSATTPTGWGNVGPPIPATNGRSYALSGVGYTYGLPDDDQKAQHKERRSLMPPEQPVTAAVAAANRKAPPPPRDNGNSLYARKDPPNPHKAPVDSVDFLARLTAQIDQPDEETLMTQHAQKTLLEIQHTTGVRGGSSDNDEGPDSLVNGQLEGQDPSSPTSLPDPTEGRKNASTVFSHKIQKPLEPSVQSRCLRRPPSRQGAAVDVMTGLMGGNITTMDHRIQCFACGAPLVTSKSVILVVCPACQCKFPNEKVVGGADRAKLPARGAVTKDFSC